jgi:hypothetical protein
MRLLAAGATAPDLAVRLGLTPRQARQEMTALLRTLGVRSPSEAVLL